MQLSAYYLRAHLYTMVPRHVREDLQWMADVGTNALCVAVLEQDLFAARENLDLILREADRVGMRVWAVPSRWGGLVAGAPKVPSLFSSTYPETWALQDDGTPYTSFGPCCSVHHPAVYEFFSEALEELLRRFPFAGFLWDEPKMLDRIDHSAMARAMAPLDADREWHTRQFVGFLDRVNAHAKAIRPTVQAGLFTYAYTDGVAFDCLASMANLDDFGLDGRPWSADDQAPDAYDDGRKSLLDHGPRFVAAAKARGKRPLVLIENYNMDEACFPLLDRRLPNVLALGAEHLIYYYYPRNVSDPDRQMAIIAKHLRALAK